jgi:hypothetical protein
MRYAFITAIPGIRRTYAAGILLMVVLLGLWAPSAQAWITAGAGNVYHESGTSNVFNDCGINAGQGIYAQDGDVVTTAKWNQMVCRFAQLWAYMKDEGR